MNKYSVMALLGAANAATGPLPSSTTFPKFDTVTAPTVSVLTTNNVLIAYNHSGTTVSGPYRAYRNDLVVFLTQTLAALSGTP
jgi:hypothetical protein